MFRNLTLKTLHDSKRALIGWAIGLAATSLTMMAFYPSVKSSAPALDRYMEQMSAEMKALFMGASSDYWSPAGYLHTELFVFMFPLLFAVYTVGAGSRAIAGEEDRGTLDLLLSTPITRASVVVHKTVAITVVTFALGLATWAGLIVGGMTVGFDLSALRMAQATVAVVLLGLMFGALALAVGCATGNRGLAIAIPAVVGVAGYLLDTLAPFTSWLKPYRKLSPFYYYSASMPVKNGLVGLHVVVLVGLFVVFVWIAVLAVRRRDLHT